MSRLHLGRAANRPRLGCTCIFVSSPPLLSLRQHARARTGGQGTCVSKGRSRMHTCIRNVPCACIQAPRNAQRACARRNAAMLLNTRLDTRQGTSRARLRTESIAHACGLEHPYLSRRSLVSLPSCPSTFLLRTEVLLTECSLTVRPDG